MLVVDRSSELRTHFALCAAVLLSACGGGGGESAQTSSTPAAGIAIRAVDQSDLEIAAAIYAGDVRTPANFYQEPELHGHGHVSRKHVLNTDVDPSLQTQKFELCTDDWNQALAWSEASAQNAEYRSTLTATNDDERYFEFGRMQASMPPTYLQSRVYKCSYLDRTTADVRFDAGAAGQLNIRPLTAQELKRLSEYLWQFTDYNNFGHVVLRSASAATPVTQHTLHIASLVRGGISATCDRIDVSAWRHRVDPATGALTLAVEVEWSFGASESSGVPQLCAS